ncbi:MAG: biotin-dependent carboxyltransferase family protein [Firmicutes bacterium]|jgi:antagonist of KipI|nr:biotin-dependent carboxyltransferase family protein [Bacillota bacterium]
MSDIVVLNPGVLTMIQDTGRVAAEQYGASRGGALDFRLYSLALRLTETQTANDAVLELISGPVSLVPHDEMLVAVTGANVRTPQGIIPDCTGFWAPANQPLVISRPHKARAYFAVHGGFDVQSVLGGRGTDFRNHFGGFCGRPLKPGDRLPILAGPPPKLPHGRWRHSNLSESPNSSGRLCLRFTWHHSVNNFLPSQRDQFISATYRIDPHSDGMALRLQGTPLKVRHSEDFLSQPVLPGTIQLPPDGNPIVLLAHRGTIGGYPPIGHVIIPDLWRAAQLTPGASLSFAAISLAEARQITRIAYQTLATAATYSTPQQFLDP